MSTKSKHSASKGMTSKLVGLVLMTSLSGWSGSSLAQWSVVDNALNLKAAEINTKLQALKYLGPNATAPAVRFDDDISALNAAVTAGGGTYGATASAALFPTIASPCESRSKNVLQAVNPLVTDLNNSCELGRQVVAAAYQHGLGYYNQFATYNSAIRTIIATPLTNLNVGEIAALQFRLQSYQVLQTNETALFNANMDIHRNALEVLKERNKQIERQIVKGDPAGRPLSLVEAGLRPIRAALATTALGLAYPRPARPTN